MASYDAVVNLSVVGTSRLNRVNASVNELNKLTLDLNKSLNLLAPGAGELGDKLRVAFEPIKNFARNATNGVAKFANTLSGAANQAQVFATVLENVNVKAGGFDTQTADVKNLANAWAGASVNLTEYNRRLRELQKTALAKQGLMQLSSGEIVRGTEAGFGPQGPRLPAALGGKMDLPEGVTRLAKPGLRGAQGLLTTPGVADAIIGAGFPALFGGGPGSILGGGLGGLAGGALGGPLGMALSVGLSAVGQQLDASVVKVKAMGDAINAIDTSALRESFIVVNSELDTTVRRLIEAGEIDKARATLAAEVAAQTGASTQAISGITNKTQDLFTAWDRFTSAVSTTAGIVATPLLDGITGVLNIISLAAQGANTLLSLFAQAGPILERSLTPLLPFVGIFRFLANKVSEAMPKGVNEEVQKRNAALEEETDNRMYNLVLMGKQEQIDKRRNRGNTVAAQIQNNELDRQEKINDLIAKRDKDLRAARKEFAGTDNQQLAVLEKQIQVEFKLNQRLVEREALRKRERLESEQIVENVRAQLDVLNNAKAVEDARRQAKQQILAADIQGLQIQKEFALSLNEESAINDKIASKKIETANESYNQATRELQSRVEQLGIELQIVEAAYTQGTATERQVQQAKDNLQTAITVRDEIVKGAEATRSQAVAAADVERRQQNVAAYAADAARQTEAFNRAANESLNAMNNNLNVVQAFTQAQQTINGLELQSLQAKLDQAATDGERYDILYRIRDLEIENAKITLYATRAQIRAEIERQRIALAVAEVKFRELQAVVNLARAQKVLNQGHLDALAAQKSALVIAQQNYETSIQVANEQWRAADAVYEAAVQAAEFKASMEGTAAAAERTAAATAEAAAASKANKAAVAGSFTTVGKAITPVGMGLFKSEEARQARLSFNPAKFGGFDTSQEDRQAAMTSFRERIMGSTGSEAVNPQVNITTGPVMQMDGTNYVTQRDLLAATGSAARQGAKMALETLRSNPSSRRSTGVTR